MITQLTKFSRLNSLRSNVRSCFSSCVDVRIGPRTADHVILYSAQGERRGGRRGGGTVMESDVLRTRRPWNKGILVGQKRPLQPKNVWSIRVRLEMSGATRELALFNLAIDSKLRASDRQAQS